MLLANLLKPKHRRWPYREFNISVPHRICYRPIQKNAMTTWKTWLYELDHECRSNLPDGISVHDYLFENARLRHHNKRVAQAALYSDEYFRITIVRNPWDRLLSAFLNQVVGNRYFRAIQCAGDLLLPASLRSKCKDAAAVRDAISDFTFRDFAQAVCSVSYRQHDQHWRPQNDFMGDVNFDLVGRFEQMDNFTEELAERIQKSIEIPRLNITAYDSTVHSECQADVTISDLRSMDAAATYRSFYDDSLRRIVGDYYRVDIERFRYTFE